MALVDYIVATLPESHAWSASIFARLVGSPPCDSQRSVLYGAYGWRKSRVFVGEYNDGRVLISVTGAEAHDAAIRLRQMPIGRSWSIARLDLQETHSVNDADAIVLSTDPRSRYKSHLIRPVSSVHRGATMYVGAPKSDRRLRIYNKTAESGIRSKEGQELVRVELVLRNRRADQAWQNLCSDIDALFGAHVEQMLERCPVIDIITTFRSDVRLPYVDEGDDWLERRLRWIDLCVIPALRKLQMQSEIDVLDYIVKNLQKRDEPV